MTDATFCGELDNLFELLIKGKHGLPTAKMSSNVLSTKPGEQIHLSERLGKGSFGEVVNGVLSRYGKAVRSVVVKKNISSDLETDYMEALIHAAVWCLLRDMECKCHISTGQADIERPDELGRLLKKHGVQGRPQVPRLITAVQTGTRTFMVMDRADEEFADFVNREDVPKEVIANLLRQLSVLIMTLQQDGFMHRDMHAGNVFVNFSHREVVFKGKKIRLPYDKTSYQDAVVCLIDFGMSRIVHWQGDLEIGFPMSSRKSKYHNEHVYTDNNEFNESTDMGIFLCSLVSSDANPRFRRMFPEIKEKLIVPDMKLASKSAKKEYASLGINSRAVSSKEGYPHHIYYAESTEIKFNTTPRNVLKLLK